MSGSCSARNRTSSKRPAESSAAVAWLAKTRSACMSCRDGTSRSSGSSAQMTAITLPSRSRSGTTSQCRSQAQGPRPFITDRYMRWPAGQPRHRLLVREQVAALDLERRVEQRRELPHRERRVLGQLVERPAGRRARDEHPASRRRGAGSQTFRNPSACAMPVARRLEDRLDRRRLGEARRHLQELAQREPVMGGRRRLLEALEGEGDVVGDGHEHLQLLVRRARARVGLADRQDPQHVAVGVEHRHEQLVVGVPRVGVCARLPVGDVPPADVALPVERSRAGSGRCRGARTARRGAAPTRPSRACRRGAPGGRRRSRAPSSPRSRSRRAGRG